MSTESLWKVAKLCGIPEKYIRILKALYQNSRCCITTSNGNTAMFDIMTGVRQLACVLSCSCSSSSSTSSWGKQWTSQYLASNGIMMGSDWFRLCGWYCFAQRFARQFTRHDNKIAGPRNKIGPAHQLWEDKGHVSWLRTESTSYYWTTVHRICGNFPYLGSYISRLVMQRSSREQSWIRQHPSFSGSAKYGPAIPSTRPPSCICTNPLWSRLQSTQLIHGRKRQEFHIRWTFSTVESCAPYWASHEEITYH